MTPSTASKPFASWITGAILLASAGLHLPHLQSLDLAISHAVQPLSDLQGLLSPRSLSIAVVFLEATLGAALLVSKLALVRYTVIIMLVTFSLILVSRFSAAGSPPCSCLGNWLWGKGSSATVYLDSIRNVLLASALAVECKMSHVSVAQPLQARQGAGDVIA